MLKFPQLQKKIVQPNPEVNNVEPTVLNEVPNNQSTEKPDYNVDDKLDILFAQVYTELTKMDERLANLESIVIKLIAN